jgi:hypothetical protein
VEHTELQPESSAAAALIGKTGHRSPAGQNPLASLHCPRFEQRRRHRRTHRSAGGFETVQLGGFFA